MGWQSAPRCRPASRLHSSGARYLSDETIQHAQDSGIAALLESVDPRVLGPLRFPRDLTIGASGRFQMLSAEVLQSTGGRYGTADSVRRAHGGVRLRQLWLADYAGQHHLRVLPAYEIPAGHAG